MLTSDIKSIKIISTVFCIVKQYKLIIVEFIPLKQLHFALTVSCHSLQRPVDINQSGFHINILFVESGDIC